MCQRPVATSSLSLLGIVRHMTMVELYWYEEVFSGRTYPEYYGSDDNPDGDFDDLTSATLPEVMERFVDACERSRAVVSASALTQRSTQPSRWDGQHVDLRWIQLHMLEEYARHLGHVDLIRELVDGAVGY